MAQGRNAAVGDILRDWRRRRRLSQLDLALEAGVSQRHLSFVESGRARPSRDAVLRLAQALEAPLRVRNDMLLAAGLAPAWPEGALDAPAAAQAMAGLARLVDAHAPFPAVAVDGRWTLLHANAPALHLMAVVAPALRTPPVNVLRLSLHPEGLAPRIVNLAEWRAHVLHRLRRQHLASADPAVEALRAELAAYPVRGPAPRRIDGDVAAPLLLDIDGQRLSLLSATTVLGTAVDVMLAEAMVETFLPADADTARALGTLRTT